VNQQFDDLKQTFQKIASMSQGERYDLLNELAKKGFVITITLQTDDEGVLHESIFFQTKEEVVNTRTGN
jgi:DNA-binding PadR family transcriptional regulator